MRVQHTELKREQIVYQVQSLQRACEKALVEGKHVRKTSMQLAFEKAASK